MLAPLHFYNVIAFALNHLFSYYLTNSSTFHLNLDKICPSRPYPNIMSSQNKIKLQFNLLLFHHWWE